MTFTPFAPASWPRREHFAYFARLAPTGYSLTVQLDVTRLCEALRARSALLSGVSVGGDAQSEPPAGVQNRAA